MGLTDAHGAKATPTREPGMPDPECVTCGGSGTEWRGFSTRPCSKCGGTFWRPPASGPTIDAALPALRDLARAHHEAGGLRHTRCICACGRRSGGPAGTPACEELLRAEEALRAVQP